MQYHYRAAGQPVVPLDFDEVGTRSELAAYLGVRVYDTSSSGKQGNLYQFVKGVASGAKGKVVLVQDNACVLLTAAIADQKGVRGVMCAALDAATDYGWVCLQFQPDPSGTAAADTFGVLVDANTSADALLHTGATAGQLASGQIVGGHRPVRNIGLGTVQGGSAGVNTTAWWDFLRTTT